MSIGIRKGRAHLNVSSAPVDRDGGIWRLSSKERSAPNASLQRQLFKPPPPLLCFSTQWNLSTTCVRIGMLVCVCCRLQSRCQPCIGWKWDSIIYKGWQVRNTEYDLHGRLKYERTSYDEIAVRCVLYTSVLTQVYACMDAYCLLLIDGYTSRPDEGRTCSNIRRLLF